MARPWPSLTSITCLRRYIVYYGQSQACPSELQSQLLTSFFSFPVRRNSCTSLFLYIYIQPVGYANMLSMYTLLYLFKVLSSGSESKRRSCICLPLICCWTNLSSTRWTYAWKYSGRTEFQWQWQHLQESSQMSKSINVQKLLVYE